MVGCRSWWGGVLILVGVMFAQARTSGGAKA